MMVSSPTFAAPPLIVWVARIKLCILAVLEFSTKVYKSCSIVCNNSGASPKK